MKPRSLAGVALFAGLGEDERASIAARCQWERAQAGGLILAHGDPTRDVFFVTAGRVAVLRTSRNGRTVRLGEIDAGGTFGELAALDGGERSASILATHTTTVARLSPSAFREVLADHPSVAQAMMLRLAGEVRRLAQKVDELSTLTVSKRLLAELLRLARPAPEGHVVSPPPRHVDLAARIGTHREAVTKELARLEASGAVHRSPRRLVLNDVAALRDAVESGSLS